MELLLEENIFYAKKNGPSFHNDLGVKLPT
jgi:hypothetical protein